MTDIGRLNVSVGLDSTGFQNGISRMNQELRKVQAEFKQANQQLGVHASELDKLKNKSDLLTRQKEIQRKKVEALTEAHKRAVETKGEDAKATKDLEIKLIQAQTKLGYMEQDLAGINREIATQSSTWYKLGKSLEPVGQSLQDIGGRMQDVGKSLSTKLTLPLLGVGATVIKIGSDFEKEMSRVQAISGATGDDLEHLSDKAKEMGANTKFSASQSAQALNYMAMAGWDTSQMLDGLDGVMNLAAASGESLASVSDIVTDALTAFGMKAEEAGDFADLLANTASNANTNVAMMGETFKYAAPVMGALGYSAEDAALAIGLMADSGVKGSQAGTTLRTAITNLTNPTERTAEAMADLGISLTDASGEMLPFRTVMDNIRASFSNLTEEQKAQQAATLFGTQALSGMLAIINASEEDYEKLTRATREYSGVAKQMADLMSDNLQGQLEILRSQLAGVAINLYEILVPHLMTLVEHLQKAVAWFANLNPATQETIVRVAALAAALGPVLIIGGKLVSGAGAIISAFSKVSMAIAGKTAAMGAATTAAGGLVAVKGALAAAFSALTAPIGIAIVAIGGIIAIGVTLYRNWDTIKEKARQLGSYISEKWSSLRERTRRVWRGITNSINKTWDNLKENTVSAWNEVNDTIEENGGGIRGIINTYSEAYQNIWSNAFTAIDNQTGGTLTKIRANISDNLSNIRENTRGSWDKIKENTSLVWKDVKDTVEKNGGGIRGIISTYTEAYRSTWSNAFTAIDNLTEGKLTDISSNIIDHFINISSNISDNLSNIRDNMGDSWDNIRNNTAERWDSISNRVTSTFEDIKSSSANRLQEVGETIGEGWENVKNLTSNAWNFVKDNTLGVWQSTRDSISNITNSMSNTFSYFVEGIRDNFNRAVDFVLNPFRRIRDGLTGIKDNIQDALSYLNPFARHSPSLVDNVQNGCNLIEREYAKLADHVKKSLTDIYGDNIKGDDVEVINTTLLLGIIAEKTAESIRRLTEEKIKASAPGVILKGVLLELMETFSKVNEKIQAAIKWIQDWNALSVEDKVFNITESITRVFNSDNIPKNFAGTSFFQGGFTLVGELGPELIQLSRGARIYNNKETEKILGQSSSKQQGVFTLHIDKFINNTEKDIEELARQLEFYRQRIALGRGRS